jgi:hypothetical protein
MTLSPPRFKVLGYNGGAWFPKGQELPTNEPPASAFPSIALAFHLFYDQPWIAFLSEGVIYTGKLALGVTNWYADHQRLFANNTDSDDALALAAYADKMYLAIIRTNDGRLLARRDSGSGWEPLGTDPVSSSSAGKPAFTFVGGQPVLAFRDNNQDGRLSVRRYSGTTWENLGSPGFSASPVKSVALACSPGRRLFAACVENNRVGIYRFDAGSWRAIGPTNTRAGDRISLVLAGEEPWVAYADLAHDYQATVLRGR